MVYHLPEIPGGKLTTETVVSSLAGTLLALTPGKEDGDFVETTLRPGENDEATSSFSGGMVTVLAEYENAVVGDVTCRAVRRKVSEW